MSVSKLNPCVESPCLQIVQQYPVEPVPLVFRLDGDTSRLDQRGIARAIRIDMPGEDVGRCGVPKELEGQMYWYAGGGTRLSVGDGSNGVGGGGNGYTYFSIDFPEPVDILIRTGSFNGSLGEQFRMMQSRVNVSDTYAGDIVGCSEYVRGPGGSLASNPTGYPFGTVGHDSNQGPNLIIYRQTTQIRFGIDGNPNLSCGINVNYLRYPEWIDPICERNEPTCITQRRIELINSAAPGASGVRVDNATDELFVEVLNENITPSIQLERPLSNCNNNNHLMIKRTDFIQSSTVIVWAADGISGANGNFIELGTTNAFGTISGESVNLVYHFDSLATVGDGDGTDNTNLASTVGTWEIY